MERRPSLDRKTIALAVGGVAAIGALNAGSAFADIGAADPMQSSHFENLSTPPKPGIEVQTGPDGRIIMKPVFEQYTIKTNDSVWSVTDEKVEKARKMLGIDLTEQQKTAAINAIKNLATYQNGKDLNILQAGANVDYPVDGAVNLIVQNFSTDVSGIPDSDLMNKVLRQGLDIISNPPKGFLNPQDFTDDSIFKAEMDQVKSLLEAMLTLQQPTVKPEGPQAPRLEISAGCSSEPAYGMVEMGPHGKIFINADNLSAIKTRSNGGTWLYVANGDKGFRVVGYMGDPDRFTATLDGFINSIRGQDINPNGEVNPLKFRPGDEVRIMLRRGPYTERFPETDYLIEGKATISCPKFAIRAKYGQQLDIRLR